MRALLIGSLAILMALSAGCSFSKLDIVVVGPAENPLSGVEVSGTYQTRKSPADKMPRTHRFEMMTDTNGAITILTRDHIDGLTLLIQHPTYTNLDASLQGFPGKPSLGFELVDIMHPYGADDVMNLDRTTIRFRMDIYHP